LTDRIPLAAVLSADRSVLLSIAEKIRNGEVFVYPTETIYGIGGRADTAAVEKRIKAIKGRSKQSPLILLGADRGNFSSYEISFPQNAEILTKRFWPGNLTLVLPWKNHETGAGIRISDHPFIAALCKVLNMPVYSTSANMSEEPYKNDPDEIFKVFGAKIDFMIDAGVLPESPPSTVVKINFDDSFEVVRQGSISEQHILQVLNSNPMLRMG
jgi:L-threonylcarbamoyladenylate synthase